MAKTRTQTKRKARSGSSGRNAKKSKKSPTKADPLVEELIQKAKQAKNKDDFVEETLKAKRFTKVVIAAAQDKEHVQNRPTGARSLFEYYYEPLSKTPSRPPAKKKKKAAKKSKKKSSKLDKFMDAIKDDIRIFFEL